MLEDTFYKDLYTLQLLDQNIYLKDAVNEYIKKKKLVVLVMNIIYIQITIFLIKIHFLKILVILLKDLIYSQNNIVLIIKIYQE